MKYLFSIILTLSAFWSLAQVNASFYSLQAVANDGSAFSFNQLKGKKVLIVNTASRCGFTPQYAKLQELYAKYKGNGFVILAFPANDFLKQEPGSNQEIRQFCTEKYEVTFPLMEKISVKGEDMSPVYQWLTQKSKNGAMDSKVSWNFQKYLIDENGNLVKVLQPSVKPDDPQIINFITDSRN